MKKSLVLAALFAMSLALPLAAETWKAVPLMDADCAGKADVMAAPDKHTKSCNVQCSKAGYGIVLNGKFVKFDAKGSELAAAALKKTDHKDNLRVDVNGDLKGDTIAVKSLSMK